MNRRLGRSALILSIAVALVVGCKKEKGEGDISASLMKSEPVAAGLGLYGAVNETFIAGGSMVQSFTPDSVKIPIFRVNLCDGQSSCQSVYSCAANTIEGCGVELSDIDAFVDALNASGTTVEEGKSFDHVGVQYCPDGDSSGIQHVTVSGSVNIAGTVYATDPTTGIVAGSDGQPVTIEYPGGCGSFYPFSPAVTVSNDDATTVKLFFDASLYAYAGVAGGASGTYSYNDTGGCAGDSSAYVCTPVITIVATVDNGNPTTEHYLIADTTASTGGSADSAPTAAVVLYYNSAGTVIGGVQNPYRISGSTVDWGTGLHGGLGLLPKTVDENTVSFGEPEGSVSLANWFKAFKRETHSGVYTYENYGSELEGEYTATKL